MQDNRTKRILRKAWREMLGIIIAAGGWILNIVGLLNSAWAVFFVIVGFVIIAYQIFDKYYDYEEKIDAFENARPRIIPKPRSEIFSANPLLIESSSTSTTATITKATTHNLFDNPIIDIDGNKARFRYGAENRCWFALVDLYNDPIERGDSSVAREVTAHLTYYDKDYNPKIKSDGISGRWWSNEEVGLSNKPRRELERTDIFPGTQPATLALACMVVKESAIYGYNNDNHANKNFQRQEFSLGLGVHYICVILDGIHLNTIEFWFRIWRDTGTGELKVEKSEKP